MEWSWGAGTEEEEKESEIPSQRKGCGRVNRLQFAIELVS
jgi:hypothetical protein